MRVVVMKFVREEIVGELDDYEVVKVTYEEIGEEELALQNVRDVNQSKSL